MGRGLIISIEGTDGSGKGTQTKLLLDRLNSEGHGTESMSFPRYETPTGRIVGGSYLGKPSMGESIFPEGPTKVNSKIASAYYAADRRAALPDILRIINSGKNLILDRYVESNMGHQGGKISDSEERKRFYESIEQLEYGFFELPRPDITFFLFMPYQVSMKLKENQVKEDLDGHEKEKDHIINAQNAFLQLSDMYKWTRIDCAPDSTFKSLLTEKQILDRIYSFVISRMKS